MVAMTPLITIQIMGLIYKLRQRAPKKSAQQEPQTDETIIELGEE